MAGANIAHILQESFGFADNGEVFDGSPVCERDGVLLVESADSILFREDMGALKPEFMVVASRHRSESGAPTLTAHVTGNFGAADIGGEPARLSFAPALVLCQAVELLKQNVGALPHQVSLEVTHHGPSEIAFPLIYVEVGSTEKQWRDDNACTVVAEVIDKLVFEKIPVKPSAIGFGGPHYAPNFTEIIPEVALGHIAPKYAMEYVDKEMIKQMIQRTIPCPEMACLDWKGIRGEKKTKLVNMLDELDLPWKKTRELKT